MKFTRRQRAMTDEDICKMYLECGDSETVAYHAQCSGTTVLTIVKRHGIEVNKRGGKVKPLTTPDAEICQMYTSGGQSGIQIAEAIGTHPVRIYQILEKHGIERRTTWQHLKKTKTQPGTVK